MVTADFKEMIFRALPSEIINVVGSRYIYTYTTYIYMYKSILTHTNNTYAQIADSWILYIYIYLYIGNIYETYMYKWGIK